MTVYYVDSVNGSASGNGTSESSAMQSIAQLNSITLKAGDTVLLARGSTFTDTLTLKTSGTVSAPITISAYGAGADPTFSGSVGITSSKASYVNISDVSFANTTSYAIYAANVSHWTIDHVTLTDTGTGTGIGGVVMKNVGDITVSNSSFDGVNSDGVFMQNVTGLTVSNNSMTRLQGVTADGVQVYGGSNLTITGNHIDQTTSPDSQKGGVIVELASNVTVSDNTVLGGTFGLGISADNVTITGNTLDGANRWTWSAGILVSSDQDVSHYTISGNTITNATYGVSLTGLSSYDVTRSDIDITGNTFSDITGDALKIDKTSTGTFEDNTIIDSAVSTIRGDGLLGTFTVGDNTSMTHAQADAAATATAASAIAPVATKDVASLAVTVKTVSGNILTNDTHAQGAQLVIHSVGSGDLTGKTAIDVNGTYGTLHIDAAGNYSYTLHADATTQLAGLKGAIVDNFNYKISDGSLTSSSKLAIDLSAYTQKATPNVAPVAVNDKISFSAAAPTQGNVLANDTDANGDALHLTSVGSTQLSGSGGYDIDGKYGTLHIAADGDYSYTLHQDTDALFASTKTTDSFVYKISDSALTSSASLVIDLSGYVHDHVMM